jgi:acyl-CoA reductase-like NAD-dependent aldehyde dehydrogenase
LFLQTFHNVINNELTNTVTTRHTICPSNEEPLWEAPVSTQEDVDRAVSAAKAAFPAWKRLSQDERADYLNRFADAIEANRGEFVELLGKEVGKPPQAGGFEMFLVMGLARETPKLRLTEEKPIDDEDVRVASLALAFLHANSPGSELLLCAMFLLV